MTSFRKRASSSPPNGDRLKPRYAFASITVTWSLYLLFTAPEIRLVWGPREMLLFEQHIFTAAVGAGLTCALYFVLRSFEPLSSGPRIAAAMLISVPASLVLGFFDSSMAPSLLPGILEFREVQPIVSFWRSIGQTTAEIYFVFFEWTLLYASLTSEAERRDAMQRAALALAETRAAHVKALRYQLNPQALLNALNAVSVLVSRGDGELAERTLEGLSLFLRSTLGGKVSDETTFGEKL